MGKFIVFDNDSIVHESDSYEEAIIEYADADDFNGDLIFCEVIARRI